MLKIFNNVYTDKRLGKQRLSINEKLIEKWTIFESIKTNNCQITDKSSVSYGNIVKDKN